MDPNIEDYVYPLNDSPYVQQHATIETQSDPNTKVDKEDLHTVQHYINVVYKGGLAIKAFECSICGREFQHKYMLRRHLPGHTDERNYHCNICGKSFRQLSTLSQHRTIHSHERPHSCMICNKTFNRISTLISHRKTHRNEKPFKCNICDKGFHQKGNLRNHLYSHTNERPYRCLQCNKGFNQQSNLTCHMKKVHADSQNTSITGHQTNSQSALAGQESSNLVQNPYVSSNEDIINQIRTKDMGEILQNNKIPFALLKCNNDPTALVKIYVSKIPKGNHVLVPVSAQDLIIGGKLVLGQTDLKNSQSNISENKNSSPLHLYIPLVAIIDTTVKADGNLSISVHPPSTYSKPSPANTNLYQPKAPSGTESSTAEFMEEGESLFKIIDPENAKTFDPRNFFSQPMTRMPVKDPILNNTRQPEGGGSVTEGFHLSSPQYLLDPQGPPSYAMDFDCRQMELFEPLESIETGKVKSELLTQIQDIPDSAW